MNYQFFGTAGICCGVLWVLAVVFVMLYFVGEDFAWSYKATDLITILGWVCFLFPFAFWLVIGVLCGLDALWGWGLVR